MTPSEELDKMVNDLNKSHGGVARKNSHEQQREEGGVLMDKAIEHLTEMIQKIGAEDPTSIAVISSAVLNLAQAQEIIQRNTPYTK